MAVIPEDIAVALGRPAPAPGSASYGQWSMWIGDALMYIGAKLGDVGLLNQDVLDYVVREAVKAQVLRPDDATQVSISIDDGNVARTYASGTGRVRILDEWWALLDPDLVDSGAFSTQTFGEPDWVSLDPWVTLP